MMSKKSQTANLTIAFAILLISLLTKNFYFGFLTLLILYSLLIEGKYYTNYVLKFAEEIFLLIEKAGKLFLDFLLVIVFFVFISPYSLILKIFSKKEIKKSTSWVGSEFNYSDKSYFKQPW